MKYNIVEITVPLTKSISRVTRWAIQAGAPFASIRNENWQDLHNIKTSNMSISPRAFLLRSDYTEENHTGDRRDGAGFSYGGSKDTPNPGTITLRGIDLGEIWLRASAVSKGETFHGLSPESYGQFTPGQVQWLRDHVFPALNAWIVANMTTLREQALEALRDYIVKQLHERRQRTEELSNEAESILKGIVL